MDCTVAWRVADVERFLKNGILERSRDSCCGAVDGTYLGAGWPTISANFVEHTELRQLT